ncbi:PQQ-binding-like beta-propeller repeat protein [Halomarina halobia]|uniref:PQQ-binding-like beta-propeller repeat protein n=1 Tax=Halomarina halobia TaxID=3033386 RepID=A0ABD6A778_9EURY|nr:PQQ-binding-like beta-propeller repeat protein [Halomarina sp. PSR21]
MPSTRRGFLAACAATTFAGCSALADGERDPPITCGPSDYDWPTFGHDPSRTSALGGRDLPPADAPVRRLSHTGTTPNGGGSVDGGPVVDGGVAFVAGDVRVEARDAESGDRLWSFEDVNDGVGTSPALACGALYVSALNRTVALDAATGERLWSADVGVAAFDDTASPTVRDGTLFVPASGVVAALDAETGERRWTAAVDGGVAGVAVGDRAYAAAHTNDGGHLVAITPAGERWWRTDDLGELYTAPVVAGGTVYATSKRGRLSAVATADGSVRWTQRIADGVYAPPAVADGRVFVPAGNGRFARALDVETGEALWRAETGPSTAAPVVLGDEVLVGSANRGIFLLDAATGEARRRIAGDRLGVVGSQPVVAGGRLYYRLATNSDVYVMG